MSTRLVVLAVVALVVIAGAVPTDAASGTLIWQGFNFHWLRKILGFETPHRLGSFANYVDNQTASYNAATSNFTLAGQYHMTFTPGVDGDYAYPETFMTGAYDPSGSVTFARGAFAKQFTDNSTGPSDAPYALSQVTVPYTITVPANTNTEVIIDGFNVDMKCVGSGCNSNGIWATNLNVSLGVCESSSATTMSCEAHITVERGWTPSHGGGKAYNAHMQYDFEVFYLAVSGASGAFTFQQDSQQRVQSTIFSGVQTNSRTLAGPQGYTGHVAGLRGFGFELLETKGQANRGRYLEQLTFSVTQGPVSGESWGYTWSAGFQSPSVTTYASDVVYTVEPTMLAFGPGVGVTSQQTATGAVCEDDNITFKCSSKHLPQDLSDTVPVQVTGSA